MTSIREMKLERRYRGGFSELGTAAYPATATHSFSRIPYSRSARGGTDRRFAAQSKRCWRRTQKSGQGAGSGFTTRRRPALPRAGTASGIMEMPICDDGSSNTDPISSSALVHQSPFRQGGSWADCVGPTWVFNAGHQFGRPPAHVILDCEQQRALWFSAAGNQNVRLDRALRRPIEKLIELPGWLAVKGPDLDPSPA